MKENSQDEIVTEIMHAFDIGELVHSATSPERLYMVIGLVISDSGLEYLVRSGVHSETEQVPGCMLIKLTENQAFGN